MKKETDKDKVFSREALLKSKRFSHIQQDFLKAILTKDFYTIEEAEKTVKTFMGGAE